VRSGRTRLADWNGAWLGRGGGGYPERVPPPLAVFPLAAVPGRRCPDGRRSRGGGKVASGGLPSYTGFSIFEKPYPARQRARQGGPRHQGSHSEQTDPSGLIYMQARFYLPMYGRFASPDPARDQHFEQTQSWNIYSYVMNNPVMMVDPNGENAKYSFDYVHHVMRISDPNFIINETKVNSRSIAGSLSGRANAAWNNKGKGWDVDLGKKGKWHVDVSVGIGTTYKEVADYRSKEGITGQDKMATNTIVVKPGGRSAEVADTSTMTLGVENVGVGPHETGHSLGHPDAYSRVGDKDAPISEGWKGNVMAEVPGVVDQRNIQALASWALDQANGKDSFVADADHKLKKEDLKK
jgi:RHS repeat-associated protein